MKWIYTRFENDGKWQDLVVDVDVQIAESVVPGKRGNAVEADR